MNETVDELLQPSLSADFDVRKFDRPWDPSNLPYAAFFFGPLAGGVLYALNYKRLGSARHAWLCLTGSVLLSLVAIAVVVWLLVSGVITAENRVARFGIQGLSAAVGLALSKHQRGRFRAWEQLGRPPRKLLLPALGIGLACALVFAVLFLTAWVIVDANVSAARGQ
jgi:hypothetical protein